MIDGNKLADVGFEKIGASYSVMDCQAFVEWCIAKCGISIDLRGSNAWFRYVMKHGWTGTPEECKKKYGCIPRGAFLFIWKNDGGEKDRGYDDGLGNATHIGICTIPKGKGAINSSSSNGCVCESKFEGKSINGGWNRVGLWLETVSYEKINPAEEEPDTPAEWVTVRSEDGNPVKMRAKPSSTCRTWWKVPNGSQVMLLNAGEKWSEIIWAGQSGWMMTKFLLAEDQKAETYRVTISGQTKAKAEEICKAYKGAVMEVESNGR